MIYLPILYTGARESVPRRASWLVWILTSVCAIARIPHRPRAAPRVLLARSRYVHACMQIYIELSVLQLAEIQCRESSLSPTFCSFLLRAGSRIDHNLAQRHSQYSKYLICFCSLCLSDDTQTELIVFRVYCQYEYRCDVIVAWDYREYSGKDGNQW